MNRQSDEAGGKNCAGASKGLVIKGGRVITPHEERFTNLWLENGRIIGLADKLVQLLPDRDEADFEIYNAAGQYVTPGLIDLQMNGGPSCDLWADPTVSELDSLRLELASKGVTSFLPTLITDDLVHLRKNIDFLTAQGADRKPVDDLPAGSAMARMLGLHLEGPCLSPERPGVHPRKHIQPFTVDVLKQIITPAASLITAACEGDIDGKAIGYLKKSGVTVSLGHSNATYEEANQAFDRGATLMTHTFNALPPLHHRTPGAVGAALLRDSIVCCLIADGLHLSEPACAIILKMKGCKKAVLVTDRAKIGTSKGGLVGSSISLDEAVQNICRWGLASFAESVAMASANAAAAIGLSESIGSLKEGLPADIAFFDEHNLEVTGAIVGGHWVKKDGKVLPSLALAQSDARH
ncbi:MAG: amidohydrolase family protein [Cyanobacteria bacterium REEB67]|nr:amidohydrolase family protein [Cyanobacteria bacterium REEB67]